jgi:hypothetical protein
MILGSGSSSVMACMWYLVGLPDGRAMLVVRDRESIEALGTSVYHFTPGIAWNELDQASEEEAEAARRAVASVPAEGRLSWNDLRTSRELYWEFRERIARSSSETA